MGARFEELVVWQRAMNLAEEIYKVTLGYPKDERYGLVAQMRRSAVSVPSNIAEGYGKATVGEFRSALGHARGSLNELRTQAMLSVRLGFMDEVDCARCLDETEQVAKLLNGLLASKSPADKRLTPNA